MQRSKILYSILCVGLCASVAFAAQEPLTPEVSRDNMLVTPAGDTNAKTPTSQSSESSKESKADEVPAQVIAQPEDPKRNASHKLALPTADEGGKKTRATPVTSPVEASRAGATSVPETGLAVSLTPPVPTLGTLTYLRGKLEESKLKVAIAEQDARLRQMNMPPPVAPVVQAMPQIPLDMLLDSQKGKSGKVPTLANPAPAIRSKGVVSIQGVNGVLSATIATAKGTVTVKQGDSFGGGRIESITYNQVMVRSGKKTAPIPFVE